MNGRLSTCRARNTTNLCRHTGYTLTKEVLSCFEIVPCGIAVCCIDDTIVLVALVCCCCCCCCMLFVLAADPDATCLTVIGKLSMSAAIVLADYYASLFGGAAILSLSLAVFL